MHTRIYPAEHCPSCTKYVQADLTPRCPYCGYDFPLSYTIPYAEQWRFTEPLVDEMTKYKGLRLMGKYIGKHPERICEMVHVRYLYLSRYSGFDFNWLAPLKMLNSLELDYAPVKDLSGVGRLASLVVLALTE